MTPFAPMRYVDSAPRNGNRRVRRGTEPSHQRDLARIDPYFAIKARRHRCERASVLRPDRTLRPAARDASFK
jgi:hypothetical protein